MAYYRFTRLQQYINGQPTDVYTKGERVDDVDYSTYEACMGSSGNSRWVSIPQTVCYNGDLWSMEKEQISYDGGITWNDTGNTRRASIIEQSSSQCTGADNDWRPVPNEYVCDGTSKCIKEAEYINNSPTGRTRAGSIVELLSEDCGVMYQWVDVPGEYICVYKCGRADKYTKQKQQYSLDNGVHWEDTGETREGDFIEKNSADCGCDTSITRWVTVSGEYVCVGTSKYTKEKEQTSTDGTNWTDTGNTRAGSLIETSSTDCGYIEPIYQWVADTGYVCVGYDKYNKEKEQVSYDSGSTWTDTGNTRAGSTLIEHNSEDCGYIVLTRWVADSGYACVNKDKYNREKKQLSTDNGVTWNDAIPYEYRAGSTLIEADSEDCERDSSVDYMTLGDALIVAPYTSSTSPNLSFGDYNYNYNFNNYYINGRVKPSGESGRYEIFGFGPNGNIKIGGGWKPSGSFYQFDYNLIGDMAFQINLNANANTGPILRLRKILTSQWHRFEYNDFYNVVNNYMTSLGLSGYVNYFKLPTLITETKALCVGKKLASNSNTSYVKYWFMAIVDIDENYQISGVSRFNYGENPDKYAGNTTGGTCVLVNNKTKHIIFQNREGDDRKLYRYNLETLDLIDSKTFSYTGSNARDIYILPDEVDLVYYVSGDDSRFMADYTNSNTVFALTNTNFGNVYYNYFKYIHGCYPDAYIYIINDSTLYLNTGV